MKAVARPVSYLCLLEYLHSTSLQTRSRLSCKKGPCLPPRLATSGLTRGSQQSGIEAPDSTQQQFRSTRLDDARKAHQRRHGVDMVSSNKAASVSGPTSCEVMERSISSKETPLRANPHLLRLFSFQTSLTTLRGCSVGLVYHSLTNHTAFFEPHMNTIIVSARCTQNHLLTQREICVITVKISGLTDSSHMKRDTCQEQEIWEKIERSIFIDCYSTI